MAIDYRSRSSGRALADSLSFKVRGTDAIFLANRKDVKIPRLKKSSSDFPLLRPTFVDSDFLKESFPASVPVRAGQSLSIRASGQVDFFNGSEKPFGPDGKGRKGSDLFGLEGISGYKGPQGALVGLFLNNQNPRGRKAPDTIDFTPAGIGSSFKSIAPEIGQVFFIGDGRTGKGLGQSFIAPEGASRLYLGTADGASFVGAPGFYSDNDGVFKVRLSKN